MRDYDMATPEVVLKDGEYRMQLDLLVGTDDEVAAAFEAAADVIRRIQGRADDEKRGGVSADAFHYLAEMLSDSHPKASKYMTALADWLLTDDGNDFTPPAGNDFTPPADAIAAAEKRGADRERQAIVGLLSRHHYDYPIRLITERLAGESDDS